MSNPGRPLFERFWRHIDPVPLEGCWLWTGSGVPQRGGLKRANMKDGGRAMNAARVSWQIHFGPIQNGLWVLHDCDNPMCVNPNHLFLGTHGDNMRDAASKGRLRPSNKKPPEVIARIKALRECGISCAEIAVQLGISESTARKRSGPRSQRKRMTAETVLAIRKSPLRTKAAAEHFGLDRTTVQRIRRGAMWANALTAAAFRTGE